MFSDWRPDGENNREEKKKKKSFEELSHSVAARRDDASAGLQWTDLRGETDSHELILQQPPGLAQPFPKASWEKKKKSTGKIDACPAGKWYYRLVCEIDTRFGFDFYPDRDSGHVCWCLIFPGSPPHSGVNLWLSWKVQIWLLYRNGPSKTATALMRLPHGPRQCQSMRHLLRLCLCGWFKLINSLNFFR